MFSLRFDMRAKDGPASAGDLYTAAVEMAAWAEEHGAAAAVVSEHHASPDGYLPAPLLLASALAARTERLPIQVAALLVPLHDPVALAEQMAVLDLLSRGRVSYVCAVGYRPEEYAMFGRDFRARGRRIEECLDVLRRAWTGEPFEWDGRRICVTPRPATPGGPLLFMGGNSEAAVRRAARLGMGMLTQGGNASLERVYREECAAHGLAPKPFLNPPVDLPTSCFVAEDPDRAWRELGPYLLHDAQMYAAWMGGAHSAVSKSVASSVDELRRENGAYRIFTPAEAVAQIRKAGMLMLQPLSGGIPPKLAWPSLELLAAKVLPAVRREPPTSGTREPPVSEKREPPASGAGR
jgi:alkanesulfonate monooxygenase SsuD/methylene tetrahydromethanopterin reductase-like flavin-dependent oxidoreductase (luciferase family)